MSSTNVVVISPKSQMAASPFSACQNCESVSPGCCNLEKNLWLSKVRFQFFRKHSLQRFISSPAFNCHSAVLGYLSMNCFLAASPNDRYITLMVFLFAGSSSRSPINGRTLGVCSVTALVSSVIEMEYFAIMATWNKSINLSQSIVGFIDGSFQNTGSPTR